MTEMLPLHPYSRIFGATDCRDSHVRRSVMGRRPFGETAMSGAERQKRRRDKASALRDAAPKPPDRHGAIAPTAGKPGTDYLRMLNHVDGRTLVVGTPEEHNALMHEGWGTIPLAVHLQRPVTSHGVLGANYPFVWPIRRW